MFSNRFARLFAALQGYDQSLAEHGERVAHHALAMARLLGQSEEQACLIWLAGLLHDVGKIAISKEILHKPGPLSDEEQTKMRRHPEIGERMLERRGGIFLLLSPIIVAHHERWDGRGYPRGLAREEIPLGARIIAVADAFDTMTSDRSYQRRVPVAEARAELQRCAEYHYDPQVVEVFLLCNAR